ncbi:hypothetical protein ACFQZQ_02930 [Lysobacter koreensis]|uniref:DUF11 domain-containing protein n=1 Tax=Lysobacter koreensis TaxID=266122 RepID=A0ABW2YJ04_9GAMM
MVESANMASDQFVVALTNTAPSATNSILADITPISYTNLSSRNLTTASSSQTAGTYSLSLSDLVLTASGAVATFRYVVIYDDTPTSPADPLVCWYDYGSAVTMASGETFTIDFGANLLTLA